MSEALPSARHDRPLPGARIFGRRLVLGLLVTGLLVIGLAGAAGAQGSGQATTSEELARATEVDPMAVFSEKGHQAFSMMEAGDLAGAVAVLEPFYASGQATFVDQSLLGNLYLELKRPTEALAVLEPLADDGAADAAVLFNAGRAALGVGDPQKADAYLQRSVRLVPISPAARLLGMMRAESGRCLDGLQFLQAWLASNAGDHEARIIAAVCSVQLDRPEEADAYLRGLPNTNPKVQMLRAQILIARNDPASALIILEPLLANHPPELEHDVARLAADAYLNAGRAQDAVDLLRKQAQLGPRQTLLLAESLYRTGDIDGALATLLPVVEKSAGGDLSKMPLVSQAVSDYARFLVAAGRFQDALPHLERATSMKPGRVQDWKSYAETLTALGRKEDAKKALATFRELQQAQSANRRQADLTASDPVAKSLTESRQAALEGNYDRALGILRQEMTISPSDVRPRLLEVQTLLAADRVDEAAKAAEATAQSFSDQPDAIYQRGMIAMVRKDTAAAEKDFRRALQLDANHVASLSDLAVLRAVAGDRQEASQLAQRVLALRPDDRRMQEFLTQINSGGR